MATLELSTDLLVDLGGWAAMKEARALVERGRVSEARREGDVIRARVQGAEKVHEPRITLAERVANVEVRCTCAESRRAGRVCPHALAAGLALLQPAKAPVRAAAIPSGDRSRSEPTAPSPGTAAATSQAATTGTSGERRKITFSRRTDGALVLKTTAAVVRTDSSSAESRQPSFAPSDTRVIAPARLAEFLSREWATLERTCDLEFAPGVEEFQLEMGQPTFEARLDGAWPGLTLELTVHYLSQRFLVDGKTEPSAYQQYYPTKQTTHEAGPGATQVPTSFWRRNVIAERDALAEIEAAGFARASGRTTAFSLAGENHVARFLANTLPRWRRAWEVTLGPRLTATMAQIDIAEPEFSLMPEKRTGSGEDWLSLDLKLSVAGEPVALDPAEIQRWLQTGQNHARRANQRVLLIPTEAWSEMREVLADCAVEQEPGRMRVARTYAPFLTGALTAEGFHASGNAPGSGGAPEVKAVMDETLWGQLRPYQAQGVEWLAGLARQDFSGLLADDMGLGKTLQALAFAAWLKAEARSTEERENAEWEIGT